MTPETTQTGARKVVYIAGPYRSERGPSGIYDNIHRARTAAIDVWSSKRLCAICPHLNTMFFDGATADEAFLQGDLEILRRCDAILMLEGWQHSVGAKNELLFAERHGIPIFKSMIDLMAWANTPEVSSE